jgi:hypothetical protein
MARPAWHPMETRPDDAVGRQRESGHDWLGVVALLLALTSLVTFIPFFVVSVQLTKALAYSGNSLVALYFNAPSISGLAGAASLVLSIVAMRRAPRALKWGGAGLGVGLATFLVVMIGTAGLRYSVGPTGGGESLPITSPTLTFAPSPPAIGMTVPVIGLVASLPWLRGVSPHRPAIAAMVAGGLVTAYWLLNLLIFSTGGGE